MWSNCAVSASELALNLSQEYEEPQAIESAQAEGQTEAQSQVPPEQIKVQQETRV